MKVKRKLFQFVESIEYTRQHLSPSALLYCGYKLNWYAQPIECSKDCSSGRGTGGGMRAAR